MRRAQACRLRPRVARKLDELARFSVLQRLRRAGWSPRQIAGILRDAFPDQACCRVSHETIYNAIHVLPRGELRRQLVAWVRQGRSTRKAHRRGTDRRGRVPDTQSIRVRPPEMKDRLIPGHWEVDLIKGVDNRSSIGTLVERSSGFVVLVKMNSASASDALEGFGDACERILCGLRRSMTCDQGKDMPSLAAVALSVQVGTVQLHAPAGLAVCVPSAPGLHRFVLHPSSMQMAHARVAHQLRADRLVLFWQLHPQKTDPQRQLTAVHDVSERGLVW